MHVRVKTREVWKTRGNGTVPHVSEWKSRLGIPYRTRGGRQPMLYQYSAVWGHAAYNGSAVIDRRYRGHEAYYTQR